MSSQRINRAVYDHHPADLSVRGCTIQRPIGFTSRMEWRKMNPDNNRYVIGIGYGTSTVSQEEADAQALANAQADADLRYQNTVLDDESDRWPD